MWKKAFGHNSLIQKQEWHANISVTKCWRETLLIDYRIWRMFLLSWRQSSQTHWLWLTETDTSAQWTCVQSSAAWSELHCVCEEIIFIATTCVITFLSLAGLTVTKRPFGESHRHICHSFCISRSQHHSWLSCNCYCVKCCISVIVLQVTFLEWALMMRQTTCDEWEMRGCAIVHRSKSGLSDAVRDGLQ